MPRPPVRLDLIPARRRDFVMQRSPSGAEGKGLQTVADVEPPIVKEFWQADAYSFTEAIGEVGYAINLKANTLAECRLRAEIRKAGTDEWEETDDPRVLRVLNSFKPPQGDEGELLRQFALHWEIAGETYLFGQPVRDEYDRPKGLLWEFLSTLELRIENNGRVIRNAWGGSRGREEVEVNAYVARCHHRDPRFSERADCPMRRLLPICRELVLLTQVIDAIAKSRVAAGILYVPWEISTGPPNEWENPGQAESGFDEMEEELHVHLNAPIEDRTAGSSLDPLLMRGPATTKDGKNLMKDAIGVIQLARDLDNEYRDLRQESLSRIGAGLDIPPEVLTGKARVNHWTGYNIDADFIAKHVVPVGRVAAEFISGAYIRPMLVTFEGMTPDEADWFRVGLDTSAITAETDLSDNATTGVQLDIVNDEAWARYNGLDEEDLLDPEQRLIRELVRLLNAQPTLGPAIIPVLVEMGYYPAVAGLDQAYAEWDVGQSVPGGATNPALQPPGPPALPVPGQKPPPGQAPADTPRLADLPDAMFATLAAACDRELEAGLTKAANRLISRLSGPDKPLADRLRRMSRADALSVAGWENARKVNLGAEELFYQCWDDLQLRATEWLRVALVGVGEDPYTAQTRAEVAAAEMTAQLNLHAATALTKPIQIGANGFKVPSEIITSSLAAGDLARDE